MINMGLNVGDYVVLLIDTSVIYKIIEKYNQYYVIETVNNNLFSASMAALPEKIRLAEPEEIL